MAERQEQIIDDQLSDIDPYGAVNYEMLCSQVIESGVRYGPGIIKGPSLLADQTATLTLDAAGMAQVLNVDTYRPYFEFVSCWDYFPDMTAKRFDQMDGEFQRHVKSRQQLTTLAKRPDFDGDAIRLFMQRNKGNYTKENYENELTPSVVKAPTSYPKATSTNCWSSGAQPQPRTCELLAST